MSDVVPEDTVAQRALAQTRDRASRAAGALSELFSRRPDLRGVHAPADLAEDAVRWCA